MGQQITGFESDPPGTIFSIHTKKRSQQKGPILLYLYLSLLLFRHEIKRTGEISLEVTHSKSRPAIQGAAMSRLLAPEKSGRSQWEACESAQCLYWPTSHRGGRETTE